MGQPMSKALAAFAVALTLVAPALAQRAGLRSDEAYFEAIRQADRHLDAEDFDAAFEWVGRSAR